MTGGCRFTWQGLALTALPSGALWWGEGRWLVVGDLHLGKSERMARRGGALLPPYEGLETLDRLGRDIDATDPAVVVSLGDGFDDDAAARALDRTLCERLAVLAAGRDWIWIAGNHDPAPGCADLPGRMLAETRIESVALRHQPAEGPDISAHFHPVVRLAGARRRAFLAGPHHLILPAYGAYTGGLDASEPVLQRLTAGGLAIACLDRAVPLPLPRRAAG